MAKKIIVFWLLVVVISAGFVGFSIGQKYEEHSASISVSLEDLNVVEVSNKEVFWHLRDTFGGTVVTNTPDKDYYLPSIDDVKSFLSLDNLDQFEYHSEYFDCDDFAWILKGRAAENGITIGTITVTQWEEGMSHRLNILLTKENGNVKTYLIEPQSDKLWEIEEDEIKKVNFVLF